MKVPLAVMASYCRYRHDRSRARVSPQWHSAAPCAGLKNNSFVSANCGTAMSSKEMPRSLYVHLSASADYPQLSRACELQAVARSNLTISKVFGRSGSYACPEARPDKFLLSRYRAANVIHAILNSDQYRQLKTRKSMRRARFGRNETWPRPAEL
jgi:hypothetical protein